MNDNFLATIYKATPSCDKMLAVVGSAVAGTLTLGHIQAGVGVLVGVLTVMTLIPRIVIGWIEMRERLKKEEQEDAEE